MFKTVPLEIKEKIISRVKNNGESVSSLASEYGLSPKTIYRWLSTKSDSSISFLEYSRLKRENKLLLEIVGKLTLEKNQTRVLKRIRRVMKKFHLMPKRRRKQGFIKPDDLGKPETKYLNLIKTFCPIRSNIVWVGDFTHLRFKDSWVYLATVMDIYSRERE